MHQLVEDHARLINVCMHGAFFLERSEGEAVACLRELLDSGVSSFKKYIKDWQHTIITGQPASIPPPAPAHAAASSQPSPPAQK